MTDPTDSRRVDRSTVEAPPAEDRALAAIEEQLRAITERAVNGTAADGGSTSLLARLTEVVDGGEALLSRYADAIRSNAAEGSALESVAPQFDDVKASYLTLFDTCRVTPAQVGTVAWHRTMLSRGKARYREAEARTGVPWWFVGIVHGMEAGFNFQGHLHNGDPLRQRTVQVPKNRPPQWNPPTDWLASAVDALEYQKFAGLHDWSIARALYRWEAYNGWGYRGRRLNTPYLWSFSNHFTKGKFVRDGVFDPNATSKQCGAAVMLKALQNAGDVTF